MGLAIVYIEGLQVTISKENCVFLFLKIIFVLADSVDLDEMLHYFIWVFAVWQRLHLGVTEIQRVKSMSCGVYL